MLKFLIFLTVFALCNGARIPRSPADMIDAVKQLSDNGADGAYTFMYEGSDGSFREEKAVPMNVGGEDEYLAITGSYRYISAEGKEVEVHYTADTRGFIITGQTIHDNAGPRQAKSIPSSAESPNRNENPKKSINEIPNKSIPVTPTSKTTTESSPISEATSKTTTESSPISEATSKTTTESSPISEATSETANESSSQASGSEAPSEQS